ncbi:MULTISPECIES: response regulator transcription factor [Marinobacterium]|jgi:DNA-binding NarL/FixJ family response regulator|uniref:DNA-binding response regulator, NarL/FixJ family, contains REC and HTH domains n=1 Tax=Marinobacterium iners DSM 11526 TaxID=1122198 RepID=A0A1H3YGR9_9GAMM|nr:response regulator transcription factor [Marinobacterium iners]QSR33901.1 DNA-binding response regulator [Marinobacterium iners]SEA10736.1 DNA-binding response regulator, NarL/FixJ family, contains REC and HTH domains [Marinobacterium iners DSM 11526]
MQLAQKIIIADDHPLFRAALRQAVTQAVPGVEIVEADSLAAVQEKVEQHGDADLVLLDIHMPGTHGFSGLVFLRGQHPGVPVVVVSGSEQPHVMKRAIDYGASGFIPKSAPLEIISEAITAVLEGEEWLPQELTENMGDVSEEDQQFAAALASLTPQQFRVLTMLTEGLLNKQIAYELSVSEATIKAHVTAILRKLGVHSRTQAVIAAQRLGVEPPKTEV